MTRALNGTGGIILNPDGTRMLGCCCGSGGCTHNNCPVGASVPCCWTAQFNGLNLQTTCILGPTNVNSWRITGSLDGFIFPLRKRTTGGTDTGDLNWGWQECPTTKILLNRYEFTNCTGRVCTLTGIYLALQRMADGTSFRAKAEVFLPQSVSPTTYIGDSTFCIDHSNNVEARRLRPLFDGIVSASSCDSPLTIPNSYTSGGGVNLGWGGTLTLLPGTTECGGNCLSIPQTGVTANECCSTQRVTIGGTGTGLDTTHILTKVANSPTWRVGTVGIGAWVEVRHHTVNEVVFPSAPFAPGPSNVSILGGPYVTEVVAGFGFGTQTRWAWVTKSPFGCCPRIGSSSSEYFLVTGSSDTTVSMSIQPGAECTVTCPTSCSSGCAEFIAQVGGSGGPIDFDHQARSPFFPSGPGDCVWTGQMIIPPFTVITNRIECIGSTWRTTVTRTGTSAGSAVWEAPNFNNQPPLTGWGLTSTTYTGTTPTLTLICNLPSSRLGEIPDDYDPEVERRRLQQGGCCGTPSV